VPHESRDRCPGLLISCIFAFILQAERILELDLICGGATIDPGNSGCQRRFLALILADRRAEVRPEIVPAVAEDRSPDMSDCLGAFGIPTHTSLIETRADDLFDRTFRRTTAYH
jgi:hypothetical protein